MAHQVPTQMKALHLESKEEGLKLKSLPTPEAFHGSAVIKVLAADIISYHRQIYDGSRPYPLPMPLIPGSSCIGRVDSVGSDATKLTPGQLVFSDTDIRSRDNPSDIFLSAIHHGSTEGSQKLMRDVWRDGSWAEYQRVPLENCIALDEVRLCRELGFTYAELVYMAHMLVPYGGIQDIGLQAGQRVVIAPATGGFGGAAVHVAAAMGAQVIAMGRNEAELHRIKSTIENNMPSSAGIVTIKITGDEEVDTTALRSVRGEIDSVLDLTPPFAAQATHTRCAIAALKSEGKVSLMGFPDISSSPSVRWKIVGSNISLKGRLMYSRDCMVQFVKLLESGLFPKGEALVDVRSFELEDHENALDEAASWTGLGKAVVFEP